MSAVTTILKRSPVPTTRLREVEPPPIKRTSWLTRPTDALPLDLFRVLVGIVVFLYFLRTLFEAADLSSPDGLIDHGLTKQIFWFTRIGLFHEGMSLWMFQSIFLAGCICAVALILGYRVKLFALISYVIAVCTYRWNFLVMYVDDSIMHLVLFWLLLLPVGNTLVLREWLRDKSGAWKSWKVRKVPGITMRCFFWNLALIYLVAGLWKWTSPMWRDGEALYVILKLPISLTPDFWKPEHLSFVKLLNYGALVLEPFFALLFVLPKGNRFKYALLAGLLAFHVGTVVTLQIPFANLACIAALVLPFGGELMDRVRGRAHVIVAPFVPGRGVTLSGAFAILFVVLLTLTMLSSMTLPRWRMPTRRAVASVGYNVDERSGIQPREAKAEGLGPLQATFFSSLWIMGVAQQYQLFNWIDERNFFPHYRVREMRADESVREIDPAELFPTSTRGVLLQFYVQGVTWMRVPREHEAELRRNLHLRFAGRFCRTVGTSGTITVDSSLERVTPGGTWTASDLRPFMKFRCDGSTPEMLFMDLDP